MKEMSKASPTVQTNPCLYLQGPVVDFSTVFVTNATECRGIPYRAMLRPRDGRPVSLPDAPSDLQRLRPPYKPGSPAFVRWRRRVLELNDLSGLQRFKSNSSTA